MLLADVLGQVGGAGGRIGATALHRVGGQTAGEGEMDGAQAAGIIQLRQGTRARGEAAERQGAGGEVHHGGQPLFDVPSVLLHDGYRRRRAALLGVNHQHIRRLGARRRHLAQGLRRTDAGVVDQLVRVALIGGNVRGVEIGRAAERHIQCSFAREFHLERRRGGGLETGGRAGLQIVAGIFLDSDSRQGNVRPIDHDGAVLAQIALRVQDGDVGNRSADRGLARGRHGQVRRRDVETVNARCGAGGIADRD